MNQIRKFSDFGIKVENKGFVGDKIKIARILNRPVIVHDFKIEKSNYQEKGDGMRLQLQIELEGKKHVVFTGSINLREAIQKVPRENLPFETIIIEENERFEFT